jgi:nitroreductase
VEVYKAIEERRTIRVFSEGANQEQLKRLILAGTKSPSASNRQPWEFIVVEDQEIVNKLAQLKYEQHRWLKPLKGQTPKAVEEGAMDRKRSFENASIVAVCNLKGFLNDVSVWMCIENISLAALEEGLGTGIVSYWGFHKEVAERLLGIPETHELAAVLKIGKAAKEGYSRDKNPFGPRREEFSWLHKNSFGAKY